MRLIRFLDFSAVRQLADGFHSSRRSQTFINVEQKSVALKEE